MFQSSWGNQGQQQQQNPQGAFGTPNTFGNNPGTSTFGSTGFGQPQSQPQQPQVNPMFGNLPAPSSTAPSGGFGAFANSGTGAFGQNKPSQGFSAFSGGTGAFGGTPNTFGQPSNPPSTGTGIFGQPSTSNTSTGFGSTNAFGANKPTTSVFGSTSTTSSVNNGTGGTPYSPFTEKDPNTTSMLHYQAITCSPTFRNFSIEELRLQDYTQNRKTASSSTFGTTSAFGSTQPTNTGIFGAQSNQPSSTSAFGGGTTNTGGFGAFGQQSNQPSTTQPGAGIFGSGSTFGQQPQQQQQQQQPSGFNAFGQQQQQPQQQQQQQQQQQHQQPQQGGGIFGGGSAFGNTANKPGFGSTGAFGTTPTTGTNIFGGGSSGTSAFGQTQQPQQQQPSIFGNAQPTSQNAFGALGNTQSKPSIFGNTPTGTTGTAGTGFGIFGNQNQSGQQPQQSTQQSSLFGGGGSGGGIFGNPPTNQQTQQGTTQPSTSIFGTTHPATGGTNIFGNTGGGLFGSNTNQQQQHPGVQATQTGGFGSLFGPKPVGTTPPLFSNVNTGTQPQTSIFGKTPLNPQQPSLFGPRPVAPGLDSTTSGQTGLFGSTLAAPVNPFGASPSPQPSLTASIADPIGHDLPIFSMLPPGPRALDFDPSQQKKKPGFFVDSSTPPPPLPRQLVYAPLHKGFGPLTPGSMNGLASTSVPSFASGKPGVLAMNGSTGPGDFLARSASPALGSGSRPNVKVIFDKKVETSEIFVKSGSPSLSRGGKITFSPALSVAAREKDATALLKPAIHPPESPTPTLNHPARNSSKFTAEPRHTAVETTGDATLQEGDYYIKPDLATLKKASYDELSSFDGLVVGRVGYGEIYFLESVDLTGLAKLGALLGEVIRFDDKECSVYPDSEEVDKPSPGSGLNVKARLILERCWATDKATREPIKDSSHPTAVKHLKRLKNMRDTHFEGFDMDGGKWTFTVDHF